MVKKRTNRKTPHKLIVTYFKINHKIGTSTQKLLKYLDCSSFDIRIKIIKRMIVNIVICKSEFNLNHNSKKTKKINRMNPNALVFFTPSLRPSRQVRMVQLQISYFKR